jgi:hypothetical protein
MSDDLLAKFNEHNELSRFITEVTDEILCEEQCDDIDNMSRIIEQVKQRLMLVRIGFTTFGSNVEFKDVPAYTVDALLAEIGGMLGMWLGLSVMFVFELFDLLISVLLARCCKQQRV